MAKFVGKIFKVNNRTLGLRQDGVHYVSVDWYNPKTHKFRGKVITSLEETKTLSAGESREILGKTPFVKIKDDKFCLFKRSKYTDLRDGKIKPIPFCDTTGFENWSGFSSTVYLNKKDLKVSERSQNMSIKKQPR